MSGTVSRCGVHNSAGAIDGGSAEEDSQQDSVCRTGGESVGSDWQHSHASAPQSLQSMPAETEATAGEAARRQMSPTTKRCLFAIACFGDSWDSIFISPALSFAWSMPAFGGPQGTCFQHDRAEPGLCVCCISSTLLEMQQCGLPVILFSESLEPSTGSRIICREKGATCCLSTTTGTSGG